MSITEKILEGKYLFFKDENQYSEETFAISKEDSATGNYHYSSELLSRVPSGEFLKIKVNYLTTSSFQPVDVKIERSLGDSSSTEHYTIDQQTKQVNYNFFNAKGSHDFEKNISGRFHISTPAFVTSTLMTQMKKMNATQTTSYNILTTDNIWEYNGHFIESQIALEMKSISAVDIIVNDKELQAIHCLVTDNPTSEGKITESSAANFYLSKHFNLPYLATFPGNIEVKIDRLKILENDYKNMFKS